MLLEVHLEQVDLQKRLLFRASGCKQERLLTIPLGLGQLMG